MKIEPDQQNAAASTQLQRGKASVFFKLFEGPATYKVSISIRKIIRLNVQNKLQYTFGRKFSLFGYSDTNTGINQ